MRLAIRPATILASALLVVSALPSAVRGQDPGPASVEADVRSVVAGFDRALEEGWPETALEYLHPDLRVFEAGHGETLEQYRSGHLSADLAFREAVRLERSWEEVSVTGDMALYESEFRARGTFREREVDSAGAETIVLVRVGPKWKIRHIHWSSRSGG